MKEPCIWCKNPTAFTVWQNEKSYPVCSKCYYWNIPVMALKALIKGLYVKFTR